MHFSGASHRKGEFTQTLMHLRHCVVCIVIRSLLAELSHVHKNRGICQTLSQAFYFFCLSVLIANLVLQIVQ